MSYLINDDWELLVQHTQQTLSTEGGQDYDIMDWAERACNRYCVTASFK